jgi:hypothetical protein
MKNLVALSALFLMALPVVAFAQTSRLEGMTLQGDYVKDYTNIYTYTSQVPNVGNLVYGEVGNTNGADGIGGFGFQTPGGVNDRSFGSVLGNLFDGRYGVWAIHLRQTTPQLGSGDSNNPPTAGTVGGDPNTNNNEAVDLMWGRKMGTTSIGLRFNRSFYQTEVNSPTVTTTLAFDPSAGATANARNAARNITGFGGGVSFEMNPNSTLEASILYENRSWEATTNPIGANTNGSEDGPTSYVLSGRAMWQWQSNVMVTPVFKYYSYDLSRKSVTSAGTETFANSLKGWQIGAASNWSLGSNDLLVWGLDFVQNKAEQADIAGSAGPFGGSPIDTSTIATITENISPRLFAALETHVNSWLTLRMGASKGFYTTVKYEPKFSTGSTSKITRSSFDMNLGAGVKVGTIQFDAVLANNTYQYANGLLGGTTPTGGFFPKVTMTYSF